MESDLGAVNSNLSTLLQLESSARKAESAKALHFLMVNETRRLIDFRQAFLLAGKSGQSFRLEAASSLSVVEKNAPLTAWLERAPAELLEEANLTQRIDAGSLAGDAATAFRSHSFEHVLWAPLRLADGSLLGGLWLTREAPW